MLSKESALIAPLLAWWVFRTEATRWSHPAVLSMLALLLYSVAKLLAIATLFVPPEGTVTGGAIGNLLWIKTVTVSAAHAIRLNVWPTGQTIYYGHLRDSLMGSPVNEVIWLVAGIVGVGLALRVARTRRSIAIACGWMLICWIPVSNIVPTGVVVAERTLYLMSAGVAMAVATLSRRSPAVVVALLLTLSTVSSVVAWSWRTEVTLWEKTVADHPRSPRAHAALGLARLQRSARSPSEAVLEESDRSFDRALSLNARAAEALYGKGLVRLHRNQFASALPFLQAAVMQRPDDAVMRAALRECIAGLGTR
jgi:hypothetical protein